MNGRQLDNRLRTAWTRFNYVTDLNVILLIYKTLRKPIRMDTRAPTIGKRKKSKKVHIFRNITPRKIIKALLRLCRTVLSALIGNLKRSIEEA